MSFQEYLYDLATDRISGFRASVMKGLLWCLSLVYGVAVRMVIVCSRRSVLTLPCKVISVGNITLGGTGKTVLVETIARALQKQGHRVAILTRGYKKEHRVKQGSIEDFQTMGDEPFMLSLNLKDVPVLVDRDRIRSARKAVQEYQADTVILDDGLQQWKIKKDLEIVTVDSLNPFGNRHLLPRGILRQPIDTLEAADVFVLTNTAETEVNKAKDFLKAHFPRALVCEAKHEARGLYRLSNKNERLEPSHVRGRSATLFCGIGNPQGFRSLVSRLGVHEGLWFAFGDHYRYSEEDLGSMFEASRRNNIDILITTEKDAVRIPLAARKRFGDAVYVVAVTLAITHEEKRFFDRLHGIYPA